MNRKRMYVGLFCSLAMLLCLGCPTSTGNKSSDNTDPGAVTLLSPANSATGVVTTPTFKWATGSGGTPDIYIVKVSLNSAFSSLLIDDSTTATSYTIPSVLQVNTKYYWKVAAKNSYGTSDYVTRSFTTAGVVTVSTSDSLFSVLLQRVQAMESINSYAVFASMDFASLRSGFGKILKQTPYDQKANIGYMVSSLISLNSSQRVLKLVDSLDSYFTAQNNYGSSKNSAKHLMRTAYQKEGMAGLGKVLAAKSASIVQSQTLKPSLPAFITLQYIQKIAEEEVVPVLDSIILAAQRLESLGTMRVSVGITDGNQTDSFNLKKGEIYVAEAFCHLVRGYLGMFCTYNMDLYAPQTTNYSWVDTLVNSTTTDSLVYTLSSDTLYQLYKYDNAASMVYMAKMFKYNLLRSDFMTIRKANHAKAKTDLIAVAACIDSALAFVRNQTSTSNNDIIKMSVINNADQSLVDVKTQMMNDGISPALAAKFSSPENIANFIIVLLSGPYTFNETIDNVTVNLRVNIGSWFDNPVTDLRTLLPKYSWTSDNAWVVKQQGDAYAYSDAASNTFTVPYSNANYNYGVKIPSGKIVSKTRNYYGDTTYTLNTTIHYWATIDSSTYFDPLRILDENNSPLTMDSVSSLIQAKKFFPCFSDYTFNGLFPDMTTRQKWINLIYQ